MLESDRERFAVEIMAPLAEVFGEISALTIQAWWMALQEYPFAAIQRAALACLRSTRSRTDDEGQQWRALWPTPGDVIRVMEHEAEARQEQRPTRKALPPMPPSRDMAKQAQAKIDAMIDGRMTVDQLITWCEEAEGKWPHIGWREAAETLRHRPRPSARGRIREARAILQAWEAEPWTSQQRSREELGRQQAVVLGMDGEPVSESVPF